MMIKPEMAQMLKLVDKYFKEANVSILNDEKKVVLMN